MLAGISLAAALAVAAALFAFMQDPEQYREPIATMLSEAVGQPVELAGPLSIDWRASPTLSVRDVRVQADGARVTIPLVQVVVAPYALLARKLHPRRVLVQGLRLDLDGAGAVAPVPMPDFSALGTGVLELRDMEVLRAGVPKFVVDTVKLREAGSARGAQLELTTLVDGRDLRAQARLRIAAGQINLDALQVHLPIGVINGNIRVVLGGQRTQLFGELDANALTLGKRRGSGLHSSPTLPVDVRLLTGVDASLQVRIGRLSLARFMVSEINAPVNLRDGKLEIRASGVLANGPLRATLNANAAQRRFTLDLTSSEANAGDVLVMAGLTTAERGGSLVLDTRLSTTGADTAELVANLQGRIALDANDFTVRAGSVAGVPASVLRALQPRAPNRVFIGCAVGRFQVQGGELIAERTVGMQSRTMNLLGAGRIALPDARVELVLRPWPRPGHPQRTFGKAGALMIEGPFADPKVVVGETRTRDDAAPDVALSDTALSPIARGLLEHANGDAPCNRATSNAVP